MLYSIDVQNSVNHPIRKSTALTITHVFPFFFRWFFAKSNEKPSEKNSTIPHEAYLAQLKEADEEKFMAYLFRTYYTSLCKSVYNVVRDTDAAEDIVQDVFIKVWRKKDRLDVSRPVKPYLFRACMNTALNYLEKNRKNISIEDENLPSTGLSANTTEEDMDFHEINTKIQQVIHTLPPKCKMVFSMSRFEEMSYAEIATALHISVKAVEKHMSKALKIMRDDLKPYTNYIKSV